MSISNIYLASSHAARLDLVFLISFSSICPSPSVRAVSFYALLLYRQAPQWALCPPRVLHPRTAVASSQKRPHSRSRQSRRASQARTCDGVSTSDMYPDRLKNDHVCALNAMLCNKCCLTLLHVGTTTLSVSTKSASSTTKAASSRDGDKADAKAKLKSDAVSTDDLYPNRLEKTCFEVQYIVCLHLQQMLLGTCCSYHDAFFVIEKYLLDHRNRVISQAPASRSRQSRRESEARIRRHVDVGHLRASARSQPNEEAHSR